MSAHENSEGIADEELYGLFESRRPDAESFRKGVKERIAELEEAQDEGNTHTFMGRVAGFFPLGSLGSALLGSGGGKLAAGKAVPTIVALPAIILITAIGGFVASTRSLRRTAEAAEPVDSSRVGGWSQERKLTNPDLVKGRKLFALPE